MTDETTQGAIMTLSRIQREHAQEERWQREQRRREYARYAHSDACSCEWCKRKRRRKEKQS